MKTVVVAGASAGLGRAIAEAFAARGDRVGLLARDSERLQAVAHAVESAGGAALVIPTDVADAPAVDAAAELTQTHFGPIDVWVNNAMVSVFGRFWDIPADEFRRVADVTYLGYVNGTRAALARMRPGDRGTIVQVGSALAYRGIPLQSAYCGAKHAIEGFTESVRSELMHEHSGVRLTTVHMPALNTPQFNWSRNYMPKRPQPVPPIFEPEVGAAAVVHATDHYRREYWVGWPTTRAIIGNHIIPGILDRVLALNGEASQETEDPADADAPSNLWRPVAACYGAHGRFSSESRRSSRAVKLVIARDKVLGSMGISRAADSLAWRAANWLSRRM